MGKAVKRSNDEASYDSTRAKKIKASKPTRQPAQMGDVHDSDEDLGHSRRPMFLAAAKEPAKRSHGVVSNLKNTVEEEKKRLANLLEEKVLGVTKRDGKINDAVIKVILDAQRNQTETDEGGFEQLSISMPKASAIYQSTKANIASSRELLRRYERVSQQVAFGKGVPMMESEWEKDNQTLQRILYKQGEKVNLKVHQFLNEETKSSKEQVKGDMSELDTHLWTRFAVGESQEENVEAPDGRKGETWAVVVKNVHRGVRRTVKTLPEGGA